MDIYKLKFTRLQNEIFRLSCIKAGFPLNQREYAEILSVSPTAISKSLNGLENAGLIKTKKSKRMNLKEIEIDRDSPNAISMKRIENLKILYDSGLNDFLENKFPGSSIILFGSYSTGEDTVNSDIDIAIIGSKEKEIDLKKFEEILERSIILQFYDNLKNININLKLNILNGITLHGIVDI